MRRAKANAVHTVALNSSGSTRLQAQVEEGRRGSEEARGRVPARIPPRSPAPLSGSEERQLMLRLEGLARIEGLREDRTKIKISSATQALIDSKADDSEVFKKDGSVVLEGSFTFKELSVDPSDPGEGHAVMWLSDGTGSGSAGDVMMKITAGGTTKTATLVDFSAI
jgi:hypothetical protein